MEKTGQPGSNKKKNIGPKKELGEKKNPRKAGLKNVKKKLGRKGHDQRGWGSIEKKR